MPHLIGSASLGHNHALPPIGFSVEKVYRDHAHRWNRNLRVTKTKTHKWNRYIKITGGPKTKTHKYNIKKKILTQKTHRFSSGGHLHKTKKHIFSLLKYVAKNRIHKFSLEIAVTTTKTHLWNTIGRIFADRTHKWTAGGRVLPFPTKTHVFSLLTQVTTDKTHGWNILTPIIISQELAYYKSSSTDSLGGAIDTNALIADNEEHNLFDVVTASESTNGDTEYRCLYVRNNSDRSILQNAKIWIYNNTPSTYSEVTIGLGTSEIDGVEQTIADEGTAPIDVTFSTANNLTNALEIGNLIDGQYKAVWLKRVISEASQVYDHDNFILAFAGDTIASN